MRLLAALVTALTVLVAASSIAFFALAIWTTDPESTNWGSTGGMALMLTLPLLILTIFLQQDA